MTIAICAELSLTFPKFVVGTRGLPVRAAHHLGQILRSFKESTGLPPYRYVLQRRVEQAKVLLDDAKLTIAEVALRSGFASQSHFSTAFRRLTHSTPWRYRQALR